MNPKIFLAAIGLLLLGACASLYGPQDVTISRERLQQALQEQVPAGSRYLELFDVQVSNPQLTLQPAANRILTTADARIAPPMLNRSYAAKLALSGGLDVDVARRAVILVDPRLEDFSVAGLDSPVGRQMVRIGGLLVEQLFRNLPLYTFEPEALRRGGVDFVPTSVRTTEGGIVVTFEPAK